MGNTDAAFCIALSGQKIKLHQPINSGEDCFFRNGKSTLFFQRCQQGSDSSAMSTSTSVSVGTIVKFPAWSTPSPLLALSRFLAAVLIWNMDGRVSRYK
mmetsp:Transcript_4017/g.7475  ORF Transcript_4017/g.7475 Transcript_4017/m.7475 type:complete len:99 (-) Transcript_4017:783-1079(-)